MKSTTISALFNDRCHSLIQWENPCLCWYGWWLTQICKDSVQHVPSDFIIAIKKISRWNVLIPSRLKLIMDDKTYIVVHVHKKACHHSAWQIQCHLHWCNQCDLKCCKDSGWIPCFSCVPKRNPNNESWYLRLDLFWCTVILTSCIPVNRGNFKWMEIHDRLVLSLNCLYYSYYRKFKNYIQKL